MPELNRRFDPTPGRETPAEEIAETAVAVSEAVVREVVDQRAEAAASRRVKPLTGLLLAMLAVSLLLHALTLSRLFAVRNTLRGEVDRLAVNVAALKDERIRYDLPIDQNVPINVVIPIRQAVSIPVDTQVSIKQTIEVPIDTGFGTVSLPVPLDVTIPISTVVPINFQQDVPISTSLDVHLNVPLELDLGSPQLADYLDRLQRALLELRDQF